MRLIMNLQAKLDFNKFIDLGHDRFDIDEVEEKDLELKTVSPTNVHQLTCGQ